MQSGLSAPTSPDPYLSPRTVVPGLHAISRVPSSSSAGSRAGGGPGGPSQDSLTALETYKARDTSKVVVRFKAVGNAPIMKQNFYKITASNRFQTVIQFLRKELGWKSGDALFTYINLAFSPAPDDTVSNLFKCFQTDGHLIVNYR
ncbi:APG12-domain-containing protein [Fomitiporia mediterranea MF3/22]|uniref:APG12-domain-containing protein n=1 Tax=Fomitiporia mediterranea (strain MF3/22) TaxID=694068 RepID=UPI000440810E|nr:APG12-domain-containing protein [Fomitiporia mediterranea MF3/22]EJD07802.1 APG12-domain-containing protein [Fomitiporia mediterranea MF3/22]